MSFDRRAATYEGGRLGEWHLLVAHRVADVALSAVPAPGRVLDVGCGTGALLFRLAACLPGTDLAGVDPAPRMLAEARKRLNGVRLDPGAGLVLADLFAPWLLPSRRRPRRAGALLMRVGFRDPTWRRVYDLGPLPLVQAALTAPLRHRLRRHRQDARTLPVRPSETTGRCVGS